MDIKVKVVQDKGLVVKGAAKPSSNNPGDPNAFAQANSAYARANTANVRATLAFDQANSAFAKANNADVEAPFAHANAAYAQANTANSRAAGAFAQANNVWIQANTTSAVSTGAYTQANTANVRAFGAFEQANQAFSQANTANSRAAGSFAQANAAWSYANTANDAASLAFAYANGAYSQANTAWEEALAAYGDSVAYTDSFAVLLANNNILTGNNTFTGANTYFTGEFVRRFLEYGTGPVKLSNWFTINANPNLGGSMTWKFEFEEGGAILVSTDRPELDRWITFQNFGSFDIHPKLRLTSGYDGRAPFQFYEIGDIKNNREDGEFWRQDSDLWLKTNDIGYSRMERTNDPITITDTTYVLANSNYNRVVTFDSSSPVTVDVPANLRHGFKCTVIQYGTGAVTLQANGTTVHARVGLTTAGQYAVAQVTQSNTDIYIVSGDLTA